MGEHTPTPWYMAPPYLDIIYGPDQSVICRAPNNPENGKNWDMDAAFIVRAVNAHDGLVEALEFIRDGYENHNVNHVDYRVRVYQVATEALEVLKEPAEGANNG